MPAQTRIVKRSDDLRGIIGAAVAANEHLEIGKRLPQHRLDRVAQDAAPIVGRSDDADAGRLHHLITSRAFVRNETGFNRFPAAAVNVRIVVLIRSGGHADEERIRVANILVGVKYKCRNHHHGALVLAPINLVDHLIGRRFRPIVHKALP